MEKLINREKLCEWLDIDYSTLNRKLNAGEVPQPVFGRGRKLLWCPQALERWLAERQSQSTAPPATGSAQQRRKDKSFRQRQDAADAVLKRHDANRRNTGNGKGGAK